MICPPGIVRAGASDVTPTQGQCCPQIAPRPGFWERKRLSGYSPESLETKRILRLFDVIQLSGEGGIRTLDGLAPISVFETDAFDHSATSP